MSSGGNHDSAEILASCGGAILPASSTRRFASPSGKRSTAMTFLWAASCFQNASSLSYGTLTSTPSSSTLVFALLALSGDTTAVLFAVFVFAVPEQPANADTTNVNARNTEA